MKPNQSLYHQPHLKGPVHIKLDAVYPVTVKNLLEKWVKRFIDDEPSATRYANRLEIELLEDQTIEVVLEPGFYAEKDEAFTSLFLKEDLWRGGDGIYSFNLNQGLDGFDAPKSSKTLFVFGDTFVGEINPHTFKRLEPTLMPNNSYALMHEGLMSFHLEKAENHSIKNVFDLEPRYAKKGTSIENVLEDNETLYVSADIDEDVIIWMDLHHQKPVDTLEIGHYDDPDFKETAVRAFQTMEIYQSHDHHTYDFVKKVDLSNPNAAITQIPVNLNARYLKCVIKKHRPLVGCRYLGLSYQHQRYIDFDISVNQVFFEAPLHAWLWLQDGIILDDYFYFYPMRVIGDQKQPEGLQFKVLSTMIFRVPFTQEGLQTAQIEQKPMRNFYDQNGQTIMFGSAVMNHLEKDGYIYVYGYQSQLGFRQLLVSRVKKEDLWNLDRYEYFDGHTYTPDFMKAAPVLDHVSCEMSVSYLNDGPHQGKYMSVMTYDTNTRYVAFSLGESPHGPFSPPQKIYVTPEPDIFKSTTYTYNAKAHPHLSKATDILVSYNTNTYNFDHNMSHAHIYRPRFIRLKTL